MAKSKNILSFRPNDWEAKAVTAAEDATGYKRSELLRRCVAKALHDVVHEILSSHTAAVDRFESIIKDSITAPTSGAKPDRSPYKISRKPKKTAA